MADASPTSTPPNEETSPSQRDIDTQDANDTSLISNSTLSDSFLGSDADTSKSSLEKHPKGKRKRTAAKDKTILEEAYLSNPKPDKQARLDIVERVSLNEKEVQIWFQNRRQNDRRKSRPLSQQEIAALRYNGMNPFTDPASFTTSFMASDPAANTPVTAAVAAAQPLPSSPDQSQHIESQSDAPAIQTPMQPRKEPESSQQTVTPQVTESFEEPPMSQESTASSQTLAKSFDRSVGYLSNRWNLGSSFSASQNAEASRHDHSPASTANASEPSPHSQHQSRVRLSLSLEGKAELVSNLPSPIRPTPERPSSIAPTLPQVRQRTFQRSHSALPGITLPPISALTSSLPPRLSRGRSRDVHAWELCADAETCDELTTQAENESNGSAIAAISLLRSTSGILQPSGSKRNAPLKQQQRPGQNKKAKLSRTTSSVARMETVESTLKTPHEGGKVKMSMLVSPTDSDKENWSPDEGNGVSRRRPLPPTAPMTKPQNSRRVERVLQENENPGLLGSCSNTAPLPRPRALDKESLEIFQDPQRRAQPRREDDVEKFMRGDVSPSKKPDMDCVAGLLSLSQGAWR
jgi:hypothetical protein